MRPRFPLSASPLFRASAILLSSALAITLPAAEPAKPAASPAANLRDLTYSGDQSLLVSVDRDLQLAGQDATKLAALAQRLLAELTRRDATFAARQALAQRLALVLGAAEPDTKSASFKSLAALLTDARDSDIARLALQPVPGPAIDKLFVDALPKSTGPARLGLLDAIASRRIATAVEAVTKLLTDKDATTAAAAARTLGEIGTTASLAALRSASSSDDVPHRRELVALPGSPNPFDVRAAIFAARLAATQHLPATEALAELQDLAGAIRTAPALRDAAFRAALDLDPANAASRIASTLATPQPSLREVAAEAIFSSRAPNLIPTLAEKLPTYDAPQQAAVLAAFARRADPATLPATLAATTHTEATVRAAAIAALGHLPGNRDIVNALAKIAASDSTDDAKLAKQSLARLHGPDVSATIIAGAEKSAPTLRPVFLEQLALRNHTEAIPLLLKTRTDANATPAIRLAAVAALGDIAPLSAQSDLLAWTLAATDEAEQSRALRSLVNVALRDPNKDTRGQLLFDTLDKSKPDVALRLLPALNRLNTARAADAAARLATSPDAKLAEASATALGRWTDASALPALATVAEKATTPATRDSARTAALRYFERNRDPWTPDFTATVSRLLKSPDTTPADRKKLIALLHRADDPAALDLAKSLASDADATLATAAKTAADVIAANQLGKPKLRASANDTALRNLFDGKTSTRWNVPTEGDEWLELDFRASRPLHTITLDQTTRAAEFPEKYELHVTDDPKSPGPVVASGKGQQTRTVITLPANTRGRYVLIKNVAERKDSQWSIVELHVD